MDLDEIKQIEKQYHERLREGHEPLPRIDVEEVRREQLRPCYDTGVDRYSDNKMAFHELIERDGGWFDKSVLDYACGDGNWAAYFALTGARQVFGFDLAESGIRRGHERIVAQGLASKVHLMPMDATNLAFADNSFEVVIGDGVLHHVLKYPNVFEELHRVMRPGAKAYFRENLADFPLFSLYWKLKGEVEQGDVPIHARQIYRLARRFSDVEIFGDTFFFSVKTFLWKPSMGRIRKLILKTCKNFDDRLFKICPPLRAWGSFSYITLKK